MEKKSPRQTLIDIIMDGDDDEVQLEFLQSSTLQELQQMAKNVQEPEDEL